MEMVLTSFFWVTLAQITMINILLSGDNAVVIALASRSLPAKQQKQAILLGSLGAIVLRVILTFFAVYLLELPFLKIVGALLLIWIGVKMLIPENEEADLDAHSNLWAAVKTIIIADFVMSLDNVLGVAAAAKGNVPLLVIGLVISIPLIIYGSTLILKLMNRFAFIVTAGAGLLGWVAGEMLITDPAIKQWIDMQMAWAHTGGPVLGALMVVVAGKWFSLKGEAESGADEVIDVALGNTEVTPVLVPSGHEAQAERERSATAPMARSALTDDGGCDAHPPVGYRWVSHPWHTGPDGKRDYAASHGEKTRYDLAPASSHLHPPRHHWH